MLRTKIKEILKNGQAEIGSSLCVKGWVRTKRGNKNVSFIHLNDGSTIHNLQIVVDHAILSEETLKEATTGACIGVKGKLVASQGSEQAVELMAESIEIIGPADPEKYPLQPKKHSLEFLREIAHLRPRTSTISAVLRIRHAMAFAIHQFFHQKGFIYLHTPIITGSDAEGAGAMFRVTTLDLANVPKNPDGSVDYSQDFFGRSTNLTVSGQLEGETGALALGEIYTFGPTFRAENSNTARHLAEFWMVEPEMAFYELEDNMNLAEEFLQYLIRYALENCSDDLEFLAKRESEEEKQKPAHERHELSLLERLKFCTENKFQRLTYTEAIEILENSKPAKQGKFKFPVKWGIDLQSEHERYLVEKEFKKPVILTHYPKEIKAFYMKLNEDEKTVRAMDVLFPGIGEIIGGSQREDSYDKLLARIRELKLPEAELWWYLELRKFGSAPHSGFGLGFERLIQFVTGMSNIRDVIPFPRTPKNAEF
ncbi:MAG: asparagine--tRNA ligase [Cytophagales bacterium]|nr:asparagine--tRNA ligase [Cytophagales bacterium]MDW8383783.1 asparagine--tRNA ligase [Flammeovirgaceae bacterium]